MLPNLPDDLRLIIFDADGTLRRRKDGTQRAPHNNDDWELMPGIEEAIDNIRHLTVTFGIASNQACVGRGEVSGVQAEQMLRVLSGRLNFQLSPKYEAVQMCHHLPDECVCRKPSPAMLYSIMRFWNVTQEQTLFIGDAIIDEEAAQNCGCHFMYINEFLGKE